ncbi:MAG: acetyl-CoA hydrolase/transferase C-terminal domain-containing protein, partial [Pseudomonadales bacterium]
GKVPSRLLKYLVDRRRLSFHTGLLTDGYFTLLEAGALNEEVSARACVALGNAAFYDRLGEVPGIEIAGVDFTHSPVTLGRLDSLIAINSALEVDLFGQANLEFMRGKQVSSVGRAADFSRAARLAVGGKSIIALPATAAGGTQSRIVAQLSNDHPVSLPRYDIDYVVTEYGVARISDASEAARIQALVEIAAPEFRESLARSFRDAG